MDSLASLALAVPVGRRFGIGCCVRGRLNALALLAEVSCHG